MTRPFAQRYEPDSGRSRLRRTLDPVWGIVLLVLGPSLIAFTGYCSWIGVGRRMSWLQGLGPLIFGVWMIPAGIRRMRGIRPVRVSAFESAVLSWIGARSSDDALKRQLSYAKVVNRVYTDTVCHSNLKVPWYARRSSANNLREAPVTGPLFRSEAGDLRGSTRLHFVGGRVARLDIETIGRTIPTDHSKLGQFELMESQDSQPADRLDPSALHASSPSVPIMTSTSQPTKIFLERYSGQSLEELIALGTTHRLGSLVLAMEQAIMQREQREGSAALTREERIVLAVEAFEREVNNGGFGQFFTNSSNEYAAEIEADLRAIGCLHVASITSRALKALGIRGAVTVKSIEQGLDAGGEALERRLDACDSEFFALGEDLADRLFAFVQENASKVRLR